MRFLVDVLAGLWVCAVVIATFFAFGFSFDAPDSTLGGAVINSIFIFLVLGSPSIGWYAHRFFSRGSKEGTVSDMVLMAALIVFVPLAIAVAYLFLT